MNKYNENEKTLEEQFAEECKVINLAYEYPGYADEIRWAIITDLKREEINNKYVSLIAYCSPYVILTTEQSKAFVKYESNNRKFKNRNALCDAYEYTDGIFESFHPEMVADPNDDTDWEFLYEAIEKLPKIQKRRLKKRFLLEMTNVEISVEEGVSSQAIDTSITAAKENLKKLLQGIGFYPSEIPNK